MRHRGCHGHNAVDGRRGCLAHPDRVGLPAIGEGDRLAGGQRGRVARGDAEVDLPVGAHQGEGRRVEPDIHADLHVDGGDLPREGRLHARVLEIEPSLGQLVLGLDDGELELGYRLVTAFAVLVQGTLGAFQVGLRRGELAGGGVEGGGGEAAQVEQRFLGTVKLLR